LNNVVTLKSRLGVTEDHWEWHHLKAWCGFLFAFHSIWLYLGILVSFWRESELRDIGRKSRFFHTPAIQRHVRGFPSE